MLLWNPQIKNHSIKYISGKIAKGIGAITKARKVLSPATLLSLYNSIIMPIRPTVYTFGGYDTHLIHLISLQNKVIRIIAGVSPSVSYWAPVCWPKYHAA